MSGMSNDFVKGIDVSVWQRIIDWKRVISGGEIKFAFIRISDGLRRDKLFEENWINARAADPKFTTGIYQYFDVHQDVSAQAQMVLEAIGDPASSADGRTLPPVLDVEKYEDSRTMLPPIEMVAKIYEWVSIIRGAIGIPPIIYTNVGTWDTYVKSRSFDECPLWVAHHTQDPSPLLPAAWKRPMSQPEGWDFWQFSRTGKVPGIVGDADVNRFRGNEDRLRIFCDRRC